MTRPGAAEGVLLLPGRGEVKVLNEVAVRIWTLIDGTRSVAEIIKTLCREFHVDPETAAGDVLDFLEELSEKQMIRLSPGEK